MSKRLIDLYPINAVVEITFGDEAWTAARVVDHAHPGVWVEAKDGRLWFVTHPSRIRRIDESPPQTTDGT